MILQAIRSIVFYLAFFALTIALAVPVGTLGLVIKGDFTLHAGRFWAHATLFLLRVLVGIKVDVEGLENLPAGGCIVASKHQSDLDIIATFPRLGRPAFISKKELLNIPFFGWAAAAVDTIPLDRKKRGGAMPALKDAALAAVAKGCRLIIFPEGTRKAPLAPADYKTGVSRLYDMLDAPIVPVALNTGLFWGRNSLVLWPGTATIRFLPAIAAGKKAAEMQQALVTIIESATEELILAAVKRGLTRPISPEFRAKLDALAAR